MTVGDPWTIRRVVAWTTQDFARLSLPSARLDAELLVAHALSVDRVRLYMDMDRPLSADERASVRALVERRRTGEPVAYITGAREFYGRRFRVTPAVLIPRPETEVLVDVALDLLPRDAAGDVLDLCTGSGAIGVTIALERPGIRVTASDISPGALEVARANAAALDAVERIDWVEGDLFDGMMGRQFRLVLCNPPYVSETEWHELAVDIRAHEPRGALVSGDGLDVLRRVCVGAPALMAPDGHVVLEIGQSQAKPVEALLTGAGFEDVRTHRDLAGLDRVVCGRAPRATVGEA